MAPPEPERASFRFTRADLLSRDGFAQWREVVGNIVLGLDLELLPDQPVHSEAAVETLPGLRIIRATQSGVRLTRMRRHLADGNDNFSLHIGASGAWTLSNLDAVLHLGHDSAALVSNAEVGGVICSSLTRSVIVDIPRKALAPLVPNLEDKVMQAIPRGREALRLLISYVGGLNASVMPQTPELRHLVVSHIRDLVAFAVGASRDAAEFVQGRGVRAARLSAIKQDVLQNLGDRGLSITTVAARHAVTPRFVQRLFEGEGVTFSEYLLDQRLALAHRLLLDPRHAGMAISAIAFEAGFGDLSYFNRTFRRRYGATPSDLRKTANGLR
jgi:AraC-like DNA-binding protein